MKKTVTITHEIEINPGNFDGTGFAKVEIYGVGSVENNGIGDYEFWGSKGFDHGREEFTLNFLNHNRREYTPEQNQIIDAYISEHFKAIWSELEEVGNAEYSVI